MKKLFYLFLATFIFLSCDNDDSEDLIDLNTVSVFTIENTELNSEFLTFSEESLTLRNKISFDYTLNSNVYSGPLEYSINANSNRDIPQVDGQNIYTVKIYNTDDVEVNIDDVIPLDDITLLEEFIYEIKYINKDVIPGFNIPAVSIHVNAIDSDKSYHKRINYGVPLKLE